MTHGYGLPREQSLGRLFASLGEYSVTDKSRNGKSNISIAVDTYRNYKKHDAFVLGFTYSDRFGLEYDNQNLDFFAGFHGQGLDLEGKNANAIEEEFLKVYKYFYLTFGSPYADQLSDMLVDSIISFLKLQGKRVFAFTWENRNTSNNLYKPYISANDCLADGHLNKQGTFKLYQTIQDGLGAE